MEKEPEIIMDDYAEKKRNSIDENIEINKMIAFPKKK